MATKLTSNRRALGDISNRRQNHAPKVVKVHRPITRKFGAGIAHDQLQHGQDTENLVTQRSKERGHVCEREKVKAARVDGESLIDDNPVKKFAENRECDYSSESSMSIETDDFHEESDSQGPLEIEMEEAESPLPNIDKIDDRNPLAVVEYVEDIYRFYRKNDIMSCVPADYMSTQTDINHRMRAVLVDWLIEVHLKFDLMHETLFLAINLVDRYLSRQGVTRKFLQLVGITGMLIACKYEEIFPPQLSDFIAISAGAYAREDVLKMEKSMLNTLQFNMSTPTPFVFMRRFLKVAESDNKLEMVSFYLLELCLVDYQTLRFPPSLVSAAAIYTGRCLLRMTPSWNSNLRHHCTYTEDQLQECGRAIEDIHRNAGLGKLTAVYRKYAIAKYSCVATLMKNC
ncbi:G2/mitotic-specific cyclin-2-like isoform X1 [Aristolochia californica]|uniref:G2/mitotic-specific cyclin-2-like isoform X1 n=1 Tax=Aristolochia californica TaxID=171875 RepID=UPI0035D8604F